MDAEEAKADDAFGRQGQALREAESRPHSSLFEARPNARRAQPGRDGRVRSRAPPSGGPAKPQREREQ
eukprot:5663769-Lingulodinium_polyedra.AAC.1